MDLQELQDLANDVAVARLTLDGLKKQMEEWLAATPRYVELQEQIETASKAKEELTNAMLEAMRESQLKSWKTEQANFARAVRKSVVFDPILKAQIEKRVKAGEEVPNWELKETEYISIRTNKQ